MHRTALALALAAGTLTASAQEYRTVDGSGNNLLDPSLGMAGAFVTREASGAHYADGLGSMVSRPSPREISNALSTQSAPLGNDLNLSSMFWQWGQFMDHDFALISEGHTESTPIAVPAGDPFFDPMNTGTQVINFSRSEFSAGILSPRQHANVITHYIDGSMVYGSDTVRADALRSFSGGRLDTSAGDFMPFNTAGLPNGNGGPLPNDQMFLAGDVRSNEQLGLTAMHTLFVREHNRWADQLAAENPGWDDERIYQTARKIVGAEIQKITYEDWLPSMMGNALGTYTGYDQNVDPSVSSAFSTAAYRFGHTMLNSELLLIGPMGQDNGSFNLFESFFNPAPSHPPALSTICSAASPTRKPTRSTPRPSEMSATCSSGPQARAGSTSSPSTSSADATRHRRLQHHAPGLRPPRRRRFLRHYQRRLPRRGTRSRLRRRQQHRRLDRPHGRGPRTRRRHRRDTHRHLRRPVRPPPRRRPLLLPERSDLIPWLSQIEGLTLADIISLNTEATLSGNVFVVPAPASIALVGMGLVALRRRR